MKNKKSIPVSLLKQISDENYKKYKLGYSIDMDMLMEAHPELTEIQFYEPAVYRGRMSGTHQWQVCFRNPSGGMWLSQSMTRKQLNHINELTGSDLYKVEKVYEM